MKLEEEGKIEISASRSTKWVIGVIIVALVCPFNIFSDNPRKPVKPVISHDRPVLQLPDSIAVGAPLPSDAVIIGEDFSLAADSALITPVDSVPVVADPVYEFNPDPTRAVWLAALCPGLGQLYNRRYWKLPIVIGGYMGLGYATSWNNSMLRDYTRAYADLMDNDPNTKSYMDFFPSTTREEDLSRTWLENTFKNRKDYFRRNRDLCIICMVGLYLLAMVDAYVDASLAHFDISPDLSMHVAPALIPEAPNRLPSVGLQWALNF